MQAAARRGEAALAPALSRLRQAAERALGRGPWSVTFVPSKARSGDPHDYYSEGPYWWPDPSRPGGPYLRRDGQVNPQRFDGHGKAMSAMSDAVLTLGLAAYLLDDATAARRAAEVIRVWFLDPTTRMNPHLNYAQAIPGRSDGRGIGIIDSRCLIDAAVGMAFLSHTPHWPDAEEAAAREWFRRYLDWLTTSRNGRDEKNERNNHGSWWTAQVVAYAALVGDVSTMQMGFDWYRRRLIPVQVQPDGRCPFEEARTRSLSYSVFNLDALATVCRMAEVEGIDLWGFQTAEGAGMAAAVRYLTPYLLEPDAWTKPQITAYRRQRAPFLYWASLGLGEAEYRRAWRRLPSQDNAEDLLLELLDRSR